MGSNVEARPIHHCQSSSCCTRYRATMNPSIKGRGRRMLHFTAAQVACHASLLFFALLIFLFQPPTCLSSLCSCTKQILQCLMFYFILVILFLLVLLDYTPTLFTCHLEKKQETASWKRMVRNDARSRQQLKNPLHESRHR